MAKDFIEAFQIKLVSATAITGLAWTVLAELEEACSILRFTNASNTNVTISFNGGTNTHEIVVSGTVVELNFQTNSSPNNYVSKMKKGTDIRIKGVTGTGNIYLSGYYNTFS